MADQPPPAAKPRSRTRLIIQTSVSLVLVVAIFYYLLKDVDLAQVWAEIQAMTWMEDAALLAIAAWNLATYALVWMSVTPGLGFGRAMGHRFQVFLTDQPHPDPAGLELRHRQRARVEDRMRAAKATGLANLPFDRWRRHSVRLELVLAAQDLPAGPRRCCWTATSPSPSPRRCATGCGIPPPASSATPAGSSCACNATGPGLSSWRRRSPGCVPCRCAAEPPQQRRRLTHRHGHAAMPTSRSSRPAASAAAPAAPRSAATSIPGRRPPHPTATQATATTPT